MASKRSTPNIPRFDNVKVPRRNMQISNDSSSYVAQKAQRSCKRKIILDSPISKHIVKS